MQLEPAAQRGTVHRLDGQHGQWLGRRERASEMQRLLVSRAISGMQIR
ncbi:MAG TPA: hypothetical protein VGL51_16590 [Solirubrobacteraceae bacterium]|jgi:hypothetical protein